MRRLVAALVALVVVFALAGCGGGGDAATTEPPKTDQAAAAAPPPSATGDAAGAVIDNSPTETVDFQPLPISRSVMPKSIADRLESNTPMLLLFFDPAQKSTDDVRAEVNAVVGKYRGVIELVSFDVSKALSDKGKKDDAAQKAALMTSQLNIRVTPYIILIDSNGLQVARFAGYVDRGILEREVLRATN